MAFVDLELVLKKTSDLMKAKLNDSIDCINTAKGDYEIDNINDDAWYFENLGDEVFSYANFIVWGLYNQPEITDNNFNNSMRTIKMFFEVCLPDDGSPIAENVVYKLLRYTRALERVIHQNYDKILSGVKFKVNVLSPTSFKLDNLTYRAAGISIETAISAN